MEFSSGSPKGHSLYKSNLFKQTKARGNKFAYKKTFPGIDLPEKKNETGED